MIRRGATLLLAWVLTAGAAQAQDTSPNAVAAGALTIEAPTLENLGFHWAVEGDRNRDAAVAVSWRAQGETRWRQGPPLIRQDGEDSVSRGFKGAFTYVAPNLFAGSLFGLKPDTAYEARFTLTDPDGVTGEAVRTVGVRTRAEPQPATGGAVYHVYPFGYEGPKQQPAFSGLLAAYYTGSVGGDWFNAFPPRVRPGDVILVHAGLYKDDRFRYGHELVSGYKECCNTTGDGTYYLTAKGEPGRPIVIKAAGDGEVVFDGDGNTTLFNVQAADYAYFEGLTVRNTEIAFEAGRKRIAGSKGLTIKRVKFEDVGVGVHTDFAGSRDFYIADSDFTGRQTPDALWGWNPASWGRLPGFAEGSRLRSQYAIKVYGSGHVVAHNRVRNFHDGIDHATYGDPEPGLEPESIDIVGNDVSNVHDNCIEADGATRNIRVIGNRCVNAGSQGYSLQPLLGGPAYFIRNLLYNARLDGAIKFSENPAGGVFWHNTFIGNFAPGANAQGSNMQLRNNLILRQNPRTPVMQMPTWTRYSSSDWNGFDPGAAPGAFEWNTPDDPRANAAGQPLVKHAFDTLAAYQAATSQDRHSRVVGFGVFQTLAPIPETASLNTLYAPDDVDFRLKRGGAAVDAGVALPGVNDGFAGRAPDLGAIEAGSPQPVYGPRP